jgi:hypothetical protein
MHAGDRDMMAVEAITDARFFDEAGDNWRTGDLVEILAPDGQVTKFGVDQVREKPGPV